MSSFYYFNSDNVCFTGAPNCYCPNATLKMIPAARKMSAADEARRGLSKKFLLIFNFFLNFLLI